jgi:hypothetical protein
LRLIIHKRKKMTFVHLAALSFHCLDLKENT